jgi:hypothetical protein
MPHSTSVTHDGHLIFIHSVQCLTTLFFESFYNIKLWTNVVYFSITSSYLCYVKLLHPVGGEIFSTHPGRPYCLLSVLNNGVPFLFSEDKTAEAWRLPSTLSSAEVKENVVLYPCSPFGAFTSCSRVN